MKFNNICIPESYNKKMSHHLLGYKCEKTNSKGDFVLKNLFETSVF